MSRRRAAPSTPPSAAAAPGSYQPLRDRWGDFAALAATLPEGSVALLDAKVAKLHPALPRALERRRAVVVPLQAGERVKTPRVLERVLQHALHLPRSGTLLVVGGGTVGDLGTVAAHLLKRGVRLVHAPSTLLAAVDSSVGGKGALHLASAGGGHVVKNALGVFHYASEAWLCPALFETLSPTQLREGRLEAWKMFACLSPSLWRKHLRSPDHGSGPLAALASLVRDARKTKDGVCREDPYERRGIRQVLNFGHTFGHVVESLTSFRVSHGDGVGLGMLCALDVGRALGVTSPGLAESVERVLAEGPGLLGRAALGRALRKASDDDVSALLAADKKVDARGALQMVLLRGLGRWDLYEVRPADWRPLLRAWRRGETP